MAGYGESLCIFPWLDNERLSYPRFPSLPLSFRAIFIRPPNKSLEKTCLGYLEIVNQPLVDDLEKKM